jgi:hypothetical protein
MSNSFSTHEPKKRGSAAIDSQLRVPNRPTIANTDGAPPKAEPMLNFGGKFGQVSRAFFEAIVAQAELRIPTLQSGELYNAEHLLGVSYWASMTADDCKRAGKCLAVLARHVLPPLTVHKIGRKTSKYYRVA